MTSSRRRTLAAAGASLAGAFVAGCLSVTDGTDGNDDGTDLDGDGDGDGDADDLSIDGRLHNEAADAHVFAVTIRDADDEVVADDEWEVEAGATEAVPAVGAPAEPRTFEVTVDETTATETFPFDVEPTPGRPAGYVDVTYTDAGTLVIEFTPPDDDHDGAAIPRVDTPPYAIEEPDCVGGERDPLWLCENMVSEPSLSFEQEATSSAILREEGLAPEGERGDLQFYATLLTSTDDLSRVNQDLSGAPADLIEGTEFDSEVVLVVQTGWGSGTVTPHLKRIEETDEGIHAFGCYRRPCGGTSDYTMRTAVARLERPDAIDSAVVSLTVDPERRANFDASSGVVTVEESG